MKDYYSTPEDEIPLEVGSVYLVTFYPKYKIREARILQITKGGFTQLECDNETSWYYREEFKALEKLK